MCCWGGGRSGAVDICCWKPSIMDAAAGSGISGLKGERQESSALGCDLIPNAGVWHCLALAEDADLSLGGSR